MLKDSRISIDHEQAGRSLMGLLLLSMMPASCSAWAARPETQWEVKSLTKSDLQGLRIDSPDSFPKYEYWDVVLEPLKR